MTPSQKGAAKILPSSVVTYPTEAGTKSAGLTNFVTSIICPSFAPFKISDGTVKNITSPGAVPAGHWVGNSVTKSSDLMALTSIFIPKAVSASFTTGSNWSHSAPDQG